jgi:hypothetical protein
VPLQLIQAFFGVFVLSETIEIVILVTRHNLAKAKRQMSAGREDYWFYLVVAVGRTSDHRNSFLSQNLGLSKKDADIFVNYQKRWLRELVVSMVGFYVSTGAVGEWVSRRLLSKLKRNEQIHRRK